MHPAGFPHFSAGRISILWLLFIHKNGAAGRYTSGPVKDANGLSLADYFAQLASISLLSSASEFSW